MASRSLFHCALARIHAQPTSLRARHSLMQSRAFVSFGSCTAQNSLAFPLLTAPSRTTLRLPTTQGYHSLVIRAKPAPTSRLASFTCRTSWTSVRHVSSSPEGSKDGSPQVGDTSKSTKDTIKKNVIMLHENIYTLPNFLTMTRLVSAPVIGYWVMQGQYKEACMLFGVACVTDALDGWIARRFKMQSIVGTIIDPMADKTLMTILTVTLAMQHLISVPVAGLILGRDLGLVLSSFYYRYISLPEPKTFARYWDFSIPSAEVRPTTISKVNTAVQMAYIGLSLIAPVLDFSGHVGLEYLGYTCALTTVWSGASYIYSKDAVKILYPKK